MSRPRVHRAYLDRLHGKLQVPAGYPSVTGSVTGSGWRGQWQERPVVAALPWTLVDRQLRVLRLPSAAKQAAVRDLAWLALSPWLRHDCESRF